MKVTIFSKFYKADFIYIYIKRLTRWLIKGTSNANKKESNCVCLGSATNHRKECRKLLAK
jgi:hypothetical protein